jgi:hypothetical protein
MKLRITNSSIRLRLSQSDVQRFRDSGIVEEVLRIGTGPDRAFSYSLSRSSNVSEVSANFEGKGFIVTMPDEEAADWTSSERVGVEGMQRNADGSKIAIIVEKDFACLTLRAGDDDKDSFPHPDTKASC